MKKKRKEFTASTKATVYQTYRGKCDDCGNIGTYNAGWGRTATRKTFYLGGLEIHHIIPVHMGGDNNIKNLILLCVKCHKKRHICATKK